MTPAYYAGFLLAVYAAGFLLFTPFTIVAAINVRIPRYHRVQKSARAITGIVAGFLWPILMVEQLKGMVKRAKGGEI